MAMDIVIRGTKGEELIVHLDEASLCTICGKRVTKYDFDKGRMLAAGKTRDMVLACVEHFQDPKSKEYKRNMDKFASHLAAKISHRESLY